MVKQIYDQRKDLITANEQIDTVEGLLSQF